MLVEQTFPCIANPLLFPFPLSVVSPFSRIFPSPPDSHYSLALQSPSQISHSSGLSSPQAPLPGHFRSLSLSPHHLYLYISVPLYPFLSLSPLSLFLSLTHKNTHKYINRNKLFCQSMWIAGMCAHDLCLVATKDNITY